MALHLAPVAVKKSPIHGYGVFAKDNIEAGMLIEECHTLISCVLDEYADYYFRVESDSKLASLPLGFGAIYNHSPTPNAKHDLDEDKSILRITAIKDIKPGEEIFISYGKSWFKDRGARPAQLSWQYRVKRNLRRFSMLWRFLFVTALLSGLIFLTHG